MAEHQQLMKWFDGLHSRTLDLVGDYAGDDLFLLDGDSLLLQCFSDPSLDFTHGLQLLHATFLVEKFLDQLRCRKAVFHVVFFSDHDHVCVPENVCQDISPRYRLAREAIIQHLSQNVAAVVPSIQVTRFDTFRSNEFRQYLQSVGAYFLMCHDGTSSVLEERAETTKQAGNAIPGGASDKSSTGSEFSSHAHLLSTKFQLRSMIHWFVCNGYNISLLNSVEFRDTKILSMILEGSSFQARDAHGYQHDTCESFHEGSTPSPTPCNALSPVDPQNIKFENQEHSQILFTFPENKALSNALDNYEGPSGRILDRIVSKFQKKKIEITQRDLATVIAIGRMSKDLVSSADNLLSASALLVHTAILSQCQLSNRAVTKSSGSYGDVFLDIYAKSLLNVLTSKFWHNTIVQMPCSCDLGDMIDGRLFLAALKALRDDEKMDLCSPPVQQKFILLASLVLDLFSIQVPPLATSNGARKERETEPVPNKYLGVDRTTANSVLPFHNAIIDAHLTPVSVTVDYVAGRDPGNKMSRIFQELSHWHNHRRLLTARPSLPLTEWQKMRMYRRNQFFMTDVLRYAASLTNAVGGSLDPETVFPRGSASNKSKQIEDKTGSASHSTRGKHGQRKEVSVRDQVAAQRQSKQNRVIEKHLAAWKLMVATFDKEYDYLSRYNSVKKYLTELPRDKKDATEVEVLAYIANTLVLAWKERCSTADRDSSMGIVALIWHTMQQLAKAPGVTREIASCAGSILRALGLPSIDIPYQSSRKLSFEFADYAITVTDLSVGVSPTEFQLIHSGPYLDRSMGSAADPRVSDFEPDKWQREVLDEIDAGRSLFVVAPTSAGKTFISFYAMKQVLEDDDDGVLVYVAPTKALVNQIAAEVQARFSKTYKNPGKSVWAIHTRDYRINEPTGCQILITVPHILQIMLLAPGNARSWSPRVKRIIFDEVHCIGQAEDGVVWEQLLLLASCPIIALSATVGNPAEFEQWLGMTQKANGLELKMIQHHSRYSELRKFVYHAPGEFAFNGLSKTPRKASIGLDQSANMTFLHPVAALIDRSRGLPDDLALEPRDCLLLWKAMKKHATESFPVDEGLDPTKFLPDIIRKSDVLEWGARLKRLLKSWMKKGDSPFSAIIQELSSISPAKGHHLKVSNESQEHPTPMVVNKSSIRDTTLPLICSLHEQDALPAILFNYDRSYCEAICDRLLTQLEASEDHWKATNGAWKKKMAKFREWQERQKDQKQKKAVKETKKIKRRGGTGDEDDDKAERADLRRESTTIDPSQWVSFNPNDPIPGFHFADDRKLAISDFDAYASELRQREVPERLILALRRGIGVHHSGMNRKYRQVCEILFRKGYLRVVIATGTLALGINMPCKTVVFSGDSVFLTALNFRQAAGRAGRRGFDFLGNVVFQCLPHSKVCRLISSRLPDLKGHFPITTSLVLRLFTLLHESSRALYARKAVNSILSCPRICLGGPESKHTVLHHLRFSIEYLRRNWLLDIDGAPLNFAGTVSHLYYTENSSFAFHALLSGGYFHGLCKEIRTNPKETLWTLMLVLSHLFGRLLLRPNVLESFEARSKSTSVVVLPGLPTGAANILRSHNSKTLGIYSAYVSTFVDQHITEPDCTLPLTRLKCGGNVSAKDIGERFKFQKPTQVTSSFVALSGHQDEWNTISELCQSVRSGVWLEQAVIPHIQVAPEETSTPLNAYLYDFFKHGNVAALVAENKVRKGDIWFLLNDFSLVLATIVTSFRNFLKLTPGNDVGPDILEAVGAGDVFEEGSDESPFDATIANTKVSNPPADKKGQSNEPVVSRLPKGEKAEVADNWDDDLSDDDQDSVSAPEDDIPAKENAQKRVRGASSSNEHDTHSGLKGEGLPQVLLAFEMLREEFDAKFKAMWA
ncbi:DEAD/DEAH box helicase [Aspergillus karnatakaensis]|uniref:putative DEAD/DEAH box helicase n=1 Tax=Aspergillus karnatakaensis TaxID=1810916 RepID=UPI003CCD17DD